MPIRMLDDRILVRPQENPEINPGGVVYLGAPKTTFCQEPGKATQICAGQVVSVGPGKPHRKTGRRQPPDVRVGQYVAFSDTCHRPIHADGDEYVTIREGDIIGKSDEPITDAQVLYDDQGVSIPAA